MSLVFSEHITPGSHRPFKHYKMVARKSDGQLVPGLTFYPGAPDYEEAHEEGKRCPKCFWAPFSNEATHCGRCGHALEK